MEDGEEKKSARILRLVPKQKVKRKRRAARKPPPPALLPAPSAADRERAVILSELLVEVVTDLKFYWELLERKRKTGRRYASRLRRYDSRLGLRKSQIRRVIVKTSSRLLKERVRDLLLGGPVVD